MSTTTARTLLRLGIRRLNEHHGTLNSPTTGYHETITAAYVRLIDAFLAATSTPTPTAAAADGDLESRVDALVGGPVGDRSVLLAFWSRDRLMSERARAEWVPPDLAPQTLPPAALSRIVSSSRD